MNGVPLNSRREHHEVHRSTPLVVLPHRLLHNIYVRELGRAYIALGCQVVYGPENFFESNLRLDILHVQWPEDLYRQSQNNDRRLFLERLAAMRDKGVTIAWTVHNAQPHESSHNNMDRSAFQGIIDHADVIHHHCACSMEAIRSMYTVSRATKEFVAPHGHYFGYKNEISRSEARRILHIRKDAFVYLHFGAIRGYKGIENVLKAFNGLREPNSILLVAGRVEGGLSVSRRLQFAYYRQTSSRIRLHTRSIESDEIQLFINAADALVLGHTSGLNSGVAVLGMSFGRPVVGPDLGCLSWTLRQGENCIYTVGSLPDLAAKMLDVQKLPADATAARNRGAAGAWKWQHIAEPVIDAWRSLRSRCS